MKTDAAESTQPEVALTQEIDYTWPFGAKHKLSRRIVGSVVLLLILSPIAWFCFDGELRAAAWHMRHGNSFDYEGVRFTIPRSQFVRCWGPRTCIVLTGIGYLRHRIGHPPFSFLMFNATEIVGHDRLRQTDQMRANAMRWSLVGERGLTMAGAEMRCLDYLQSNRRSHSIFCYGSDTPVVATFTGNGDPSSFYELLSTAKRQ